MCEGFAQCHLYKVCVDKRFLVQKPFAIVGPDVDAVQVQSLNNVQWVLAAGKGLAHGRVNEPLKRWDGIRDAPVQCLEDSLSTGHDMNSSNRRWFTWLTAGYRSR